jgi:hypothetical protein
MEPAKLRIFKIAVPKTEVLEQPQSITFILWSYCPYAEKTGKTAAGDARKRETAYSGVAVWRNQQPRPEARTRERAEGSNPLRHE